MTHKTRSYQNTSEMACCFVLNKIMHNFGLTNEEMMQVLGKKDYRSFNKYTKAPGRVVTLEMYVRISQSVYEGNMNHLMMDINDAKSIKNIDDYILFLEMDRKREGFMRYKKEKKDLLEMSVDMEEVRKNFHHNILALKTHYRTTFELIAKDINVRPTTMKSWFDSSAPNIIPMQALCNLFNCQMSDLLEKKA